MNRTELEARLGRYSWYHRIKIADDLYTPSRLPHFQRMWDFNLRAMDVADYTDKRVLDVACRDGLFSFEAERRGAREVIGIDNDLSRGATELLIPYLDSKVRMYEMNLLDVTPERFGTFDIIQCFGVLYHVRYPIWGLKKLLDCLSDGGMLLIESGMLVDPRYEDVEFLYCPVEDSPFEPSSCTFFNRKGLDVTMRSLGCEAVDCKTLGRDFVGREGPGLFEPLKNRLRIMRLRWRRAAPWVDRQFLTYRKNDSVKNAGLARYWDATHNTHSESTDY